MTTQARSKMMDWIQGIGGAVIVSLLSWVLGTLNAVHSDIQDLHIKFARLEVTVARLDDMRGDIRDLDTQHRALAERVTRLEPQQAAK